MDQRSKRGGLWAGGIHFTHIDRQNKGGGGVAIFVDKKLNFRVIEDMSTVVNNLLECITIEIYKEKMKNVAAYIGHQVLVSNCSQSEWRRCFQKLVTRQFSSVETSI